MPLLLAAGCSSDDETATTTTLSAEAQAALDDGLELLLEQAEVDPAAVAAEVSDCLLDEIRTEPALATYLARFDELEAPEGTLDGPEIVVAMEGTVALLEAYGHCGLQDEAAALAEEQRMTIGQIRCLATRISSDADLAEVVAADFDVSRHPDAATAMFELYATCDLGSLMASELPGWTPEQADCYFDQIVRLEADHPGLALVASGEAGEPTEEQRAAVSSALNRCGVET